MNASALRGLPSGLPIAVSQPAGPLHLDLPPFGRLPIGVSQTCLPRSVRRKAVRVGPRMPDKRARAGRQQQRTQ
jgi:hypothetical protein